MTVQERKKAGVVAMGILRRLLCRAMVGRGRWNSGPLHRRVIGGHGSAAAIGALACALAGAVATAAAPALASECPNEQLRAEQAHAHELPDCRAYEMVSPLDKNDSNAFDQEAGSRVSVSGEAITYGSRGYFGSPGGTEYFGQYRSLRETNGWATTNITPPYTAYEITLRAPFQGLAFTPDLAKGIADTTAQLTPEVPAGLENLYVVDLDNGSYEWATQGSPENEPYNFRNELRIVGASTDLSHVVYENSGSGVFEMWANGKSRPVAIGLEGKRIAALPGDGADAFTYYWRSVSDDGSRVFMTSPVESNEPDRHVYVRENPAQPQSPLNAEGLCTTPSDACTLDVSASHRIGGDPHGPQPARYRGASVDGSRAFFTSGEELTDDANTGSADQAENLYEYDLGNKQLTDLTVDSNPEDANGAAVMGVAYISEDGSYVYFVAEGDLAAGAVSGQPNLYVYHHGEVDFITTLSPADSGDWLEEAGKHNVRMNTAGTRFAFKSVRSVTGYDNTDANTGQPDAEIFSYDAESHELVCASCNPSGARPIGSSGFGNEELLGFRTYAQRNFSEDGSRLFFQSKDALAHDSNGLQDVYELENGHVYPISDAAGGYESVFLDASPDGSDVFIGTTDQLVPQDRDLLGDVYDARIGGGFPVPAAVHVCDNGDSCKPPASPQPATLGAPASATFSGAGNVIPVPQIKLQVKPKAKPKPKPKCKKGVGKKHRKCVKQKAKKSKRSTTGRS